MRLQSRLFPAGSDVEMVKNARFSNILKLFEQKTIDLKQEKKLLLKRTSVKFFVKFAAGLHDQIDSC